MDRVNTGKWWRMQHKTESDKFVVFTVDYAPRLSKDRTPDNVMMKMRHEDRMGSSENVHPLPLKEMREEWEKRVQEGYIYNGD